MCRNTSAKTAGSILTEGYRANPALNNQPWGQILCIGRMMFMDQHVGLVSSNEPFVVHSLHAFKIYEQPCKWFSIVYNFEKV
jgi:hypothetical protein